MLLAPAGLLVFLLLGLAPAIIRAFGAVLRAPRLLALLLLLFFALPHVILLVYEVAQPQRPALAAHARR